MYERTLSNGKVLSFGHEGILYQQSFIMYDKETESLWVHVTGEAIKGPLKGERLKFVPCALTTWTQWKAHYPDTKVLDGQRAPGFMGTYTGNDERRQDFGLAVFFPGQVKMYPYDILAEKKILHDTVNGQDIVLVLSVRTGVARAFAPNVDGERLNFLLLDESEEDELLLTDEETESVWDGLSGRALDGAYADEQLPVFVSLPILSSRFPVFYPDGLIHGEKPADEGE